MAFRVSPHDTRAGELLQNEAEEWEQPAVTGFLLYGYRDQEGKRPIDRLIAARGRTFPPGEVAALVAIQGSRASLFEVEAVQLGSGIDLHDLVTGDRVHVHEISGTAQVKKWDVLFAWIMQCEGHFELTGATLLIPRPHLDRVRKKLEKELARARREHPDVSERDLVGAVAWAPIVELRTAIRDFRMPTLQTMDEESLVFVKAHYAVRDRDAVRDRLSKMRELEPDDEDVFVWVNRAGNSKLGSGPVALGRIVIERDELVLETMSRERNARGRAMLEEQLGSLIVHRADSIEDPEAAIRRRLERGTREPREEVPEEVQREVVGQYLREHYKRWLDDPLPALGGKSPRKAARSKRGRVQVEALLKEMENGTLDQVGGDTVDFAAMRRDLGLRPDSTTNITYDADRTPPASWLEDDETVRAATVESYHRSLSNHPAMPNPRLHALMHVIVENQLAADQPVEVRPTLERLVDDGLTRHEAIHAIGSVVAEQLFKVMNEGVDLDRDFVTRSLARLRAAAWRFSQ
jgi:hypothetical protein